MKNMITKRFMLCMLLSFFVSLAFAQQARTITGTVKDEKGAPIPFAAVQVKGTTTGATTDENGAFSVSVSGEGAVLVASSLGYKTQEVPVGESNTINVVLGSNASELGEVVVTALGVEKQNAQLGYSVTTVGGADIERTNTVNPITALQGKVAGVNINVSGVSGVQTSPSILIRGATSLTKNNQPIFVVDGIVLQNNIVGPDAGGDAGSQLKNLNPDDYESITVLKGAAATSIYGSRGINGAIVITTKRGEIGQGLGLEYNTTYQYTDVYENSIPLQNVYGMASLAREGHFRPDGTQNSSVRNFGPKMDGSLHPAVYNSELLVPYSPKPDNWKAVYQDGNYINNNIALSGGSDKYTYRLSYSNTQNKGTLINNRLGRNAFDIKSSGQITDIFSVEMGVSYANTLTTNYYGQSRYYHPTGQNVGFLTYYGVPRNADLKAWRNNYRNPDGSLRNYGYDPFNGRVNSTFNRFDNYDQERTENSFLGNLMLKAQLNPWLDLSARGNYNFLKIFNETREGGSGAGGIGGSYGVGGTYNSNYNMLFMAHATRQALNDDLKIDFRILNEIYGNGSSESYRRSTRGGLAVPNEFVLGNTTDIPIYNPERPNDGQIDYTYATPSNKVIGLAGIVNFSYKEFINLELTARNDWVSSLTYPAGVAGANNYSVFYPSANLSYSFFDHFNEAMPSWLSSGRLRAALAYVGSGTDPYATSFTGFVPNAVFDANGNSIGIATQQNANVLPNPNLKPEIQRALEFGTNFGLFDDKLTVDFAYYKTNTFNQILRLPGVQETGYSSVLINAGNIQNQGIELLVAANPIRNEDFNWDMAVNFTRNRSKIVEFYPGITEYALMGNYNGASVYAYEGGAFGVMTAENNGAYAFTDPATGFPLLTVADPLASVNPDTRYNVANYNFVYDKEPDVPRYALGSIEPDFLAGFNTSLRYKDWSLFAQVDARVGGLVYSESYNYAMGVGSPEASLKYRDQEHGGVARIDSYTGETVYNGVIPDAVFDKDQVSPITGADISGMTFREAYEQGLVEPWQASAYYAYNYGFGTNLNFNGSTTENTWVMLREISLGYRLPQSLLSKVHIKGAGLRLSARNIGYIYNGLAAGQNPESLQSNDPFSPVITGGVPFSRNYAVTLNVSF